jgi:hypothetical protein
MSADREKLPLLKELVSLEAYDARCRDPRNHTNQHEIGALIRVISCEFVDRHPFLSLPIMIVFAASLA